MINLLENGQVKDIAVSSINILDYSENYYWIVDYDTDNKFLEIAPYMTGIAEIDIANGTLILDVEDAGISVLTNRIQGNANFFKWDVKFEKGNFDDLVGGGTDAMKWNYTYWDTKDENAESETYYRKNAMAYIDFDADDNNMNVDGVTNFVTVLVRKDNEGIPENFEGLPA